MGKKTLIIQRQQGIITRIKSLVMQSRMESSGLIDWPQIAAHLFHPLLTGGKGSVHG